MKSLKTTLRQHFFKYALIPLLIIETSLLGLYFLVNQYTTDYNSQLLKQETLNSTQKILISEAKNIQQELVEIKKFSSLLQKIMSRFLTTQNSIYPIILQALKLPTMASFTKVPQKTPVSIIHPKP